MALGAGAGVALVAGFAMLLPQVRQAALDVAPAWRAALSDATPLTTAAAPGGDAVAPASVVEEAPASDTRDTASGADPNAEAPPAAGTDKQDSDVADRPRIDTIRVAPDGETVLAGRARPGDRVRVLVDGAPAAEGRADGGGQFVIFLSLGGSDRPRRMTLLGDPEGDALLSEATTIIAPNAAPEPETERLAAAAPEPAGTGEGAEAEPVAASEAGQDRADATKSAAAGDAETQAAGSSSSETGRTPRPRILLPDPPGTRLAAPAPAAGSAPELPVALSAAPESPAAPAREAQARPPVLQADGGGLQLIQPALGPGATPEVLESVALDAIAYGPGGTLGLQGRARPGHSVRLYLDDAAVLDSAVGPQGGWEAGLDDLAPGLYRMRVDEIDAAGRVTSRIEMPFKRESREAIRDSLREEIAARGVAARTVQPGNTLWGIASERYGEGMAYMHVFEANAERIRNPDLIYPGQVFVLPEIDGG
ncbi:LysM domain-containing protein [Limimaricola pyoseonensis]|uniref:LysM domain-containing protein n=2 Tax=Limimaricola pyoseonensis TaxID=521013 RepID=A0A1G6ZRI5_9RHOB|nr:LysM domain-containing protein [Limimaricola pyoseonensis]